MSVLMGEEHSRTKIPLKNGYSSLPNLCGALPAAKLLMFAKDFPFYTAWGSDGLRIRIDSDRCWTDQLSRCIEAGGLKRELGCVRRKTSKTERKENSSDCHRLKGHPWHPSNELGLSLTLRPDNVWGQPYTDVTGNSTGDYS
jgi:hypothetical protein